MRTTITAALVTCAAAVLAGCTTPSTTTATPATTSTVRTATPPVTTSTATTTPAAVYRPGELRPQDRAYLAKLNDFWRTADNATAIEGGESVCTRYRRGDDKTAILSDLIEVSNLDNGINLMYAAVSAYCPEYLVGIK